MDYPALIIPVTKVDPKVDVEPIRESFLSAEDEHIHKMCQFLSVVHFRVFIELLTLGCADDPEVYKGMPVGIQLVGPTLQEEVVLGAGEVIDAVLSSSRRD